MSRQSELARQLLQAAVYDPEGPLQAEWGGKASLVPTNLLTQIAMDGQLGSQFADTPPIQHVDEIAQSILDKGITKPVPVSLGRAPGNPGRLLANLSDGHHRVSAARALGLPFFPAVGFQASNIRDWFAGDGTFDPAVLKGTGRLPVPHLGPEINRQRFMLEESVPAIKRIAEAQRRGLPEQLLQLDELLELGVVPAGREWDFVGSTRANNPIGYGFAPSQAEAAIQDLGRVIQPTSTSVAKRSASFPTFIDSVRKQAAEGLWPPGMFDPQDVPKTSKLSEHLLMNVGKPTPKIRGFPGTKGMFGIAAGLAAPFIGQKLFKKDDNSFASQTARAIGVA